MKTILVVNVNSFVDLITNSSSELFVCDTDKSVQTVKEIVEELVKTHDKLEGTNYLPKLWTDVFEEPELAKYNWDYYKVPREITDKYEKYHRNPVADSLYFYNSINEKNYENSERYRKLLKKEGELSKSLGIHEKNLYETNPVEYNRRWAEYRIKREKIWARWTKDASKSEMDLYKEFLKMNDFSQNEIDRVDLLPKHKHFIYPPITENKEEPWRGAPDPMERICNEFRHYLGYGITMKKNSILLKSADDNTIPFEIFSTLESYLSANRYHIG